MFELHEDATPLVVDGVRQPLQARDELRVVDASHPRGGAAALVADDGRPLEEQAGAGLGGRDEFVDQHVDGVLAVAGALQKRCPVEPVGQPAAADFEGRLQPWHLRWGTSQWVKTPRLDRISGAA